MKIRILFTIHIDDQYADDLMEVASADSNSVRDIAPFIREVAEGEVQMLLDDNLIPHTITYPRN